MMSEHMTTIYLLLNLIHGSSDVFLYLNTALLQQNNEWLPLKDASGPATYWLPWTSRSRCGHIS